MQLVPGRIRKAPQHAPDTRRAFLQPHQLGGTPESGPAPLGAVPVRVQVAHALARVSMSLGHRRSVATAHVMTGPRGQGAG